MAAVALPPAKFYGRDLPRPRFFEDGDLNSVRVDPPTGVNSALLAWAAEASWEMGGLNTKKRRRAPSRIEGRVEKLRVLAKRARRAEAKEAKTSRRGRATKKSALGKRAAAALEEEEEEDMFEDSEDEEEAQSEEQTVRRRLLVEDEDEEVEEEDGEGEDDDEEEEEDDVRDVVDASADSADEEADVATPLPSLTRATRSAKLGSKGAPRARSVKTEPVLAPVKSKAGSQRILLGTEVQLTKMERRSSASIPTRPAKGSGADPFAFASNSPEAAKSSRRHTRKTPDLITARGRAAGAVQGQNGRRTRGQGVEQQHSPDTTSTGLSDSPPRADSSSESDTLRPRLLELELDAVAEGLAAGRQMFRDVESGNRRSSRSSAAASGGRNARASSQDPKAPGSSVRRRLA